MGNLLDMDCTSQLLQLKAGKVYSDSYFVMAFPLTSYSGFTTAFVSSLEI